MKYSNVGARIYPARAYQREIPIFFEAPSVRLSRVAVSITALA